MNNIPLKQIRKVAVFRALQLGDLLCSIPALRALRASLPDAEITLIGLPWAESLVSRYPAYLQHFIHFPGYEGLPEQPFQPEAYQAFVERVRSEQFDLLVQMQGNGTIVNDIMANWGAKYLLAFSPDAVDDESQSGLTNGHSLTYPDTLHEIDRHLALMAHTGIASQGRELEFPIYPADLQEYDALQLQLSVQQYVCIHPGSRGSWRQWPPEYFAMLGNYCSDLGYRVVLTGTKGERAIVDQVAAAFHTEPLITAGRTGLGAMAVLIANARLLISNCTGVAHMASALRTPGVVISMDGEPARWGPLNKQLHHTIDWTRDQRFGEVLDAAKDLLSAASPNGSQTGAAHSTGAAPVRASR